MCFLILQVTRTTPCRLNNLQSVQNLFTDDLTFIYIKIRSDYLLTQDWNFNEFTDQSIDEQNHKWELDYEQLPQQLKDKIIDWGIPLAHTV